MEKIYSSMAEGWLELWCVKQEQVLCSGTQSCHKQNLRFLLWGSLQMMTHRMGSLFRLSQLASSQKSFLKERQCFEFV